MGVDRKLDLVSSEVLDRISLSGETIKAQYHELLWKAVRHNFLRHRESNISRTEDPSPLRDCGVSSWIRFLTISTRSSIQGVFVGLGGLL